MSNYRCFKEEIKFSMIVFNYDRDICEVENVVYLFEFDLCLLRSVVVYGVNVSGKMKFIEGMVFMKYFIF